MGLRGKQRGKAKQRLLSEEAVDSLLSKLQAHQGQQLTDDDYDALTGVVQTWAHLTELVGRKSASIREIRRVLGLSLPRQSPAQPKSADVDGVVDRGNGDSGDDDTAETSPSDVTFQMDEKSGDANGSQNRDLHGRRSADDFEQLDHMHHGHVSLHSGDECPACLRGRVYKYRPSEFTSISGRSPLVATRHTRDTLRCNLCDEVFKAPLPAALEADGVGGTTLYTYSAVAIVCILRCFGGLPMARQDRLQAALGIPVPDSSIWDMHERLAAAMRPIWRYLVIEAANAPLYFGDDTGATILTKRSEVKPDRRSGELKHRTGCHTTCIIAVDEDDHASVLYFTGIHHAGEVMDLIVAERESDLAPPIFMGDCIESNSVTAAKVYYAGCNAHAVRRFKALADRYPEQADYVLERYKKIYDNDDYCIEAELSPEERRDYHREHSRPLLREISEYGEALFEERTVEPNSDLGEAFEYVIGNERRLSAFARHPKAAVDNNRVERALRTSVRLRETTHFFRNPIGAGIADTILSVGATALHERLNLFDYFVDIQRHAEAVRDDPGAWAPWHYRASRTTIASTGPPKREPPPIVAVT